MIPSPNRPAVRRAFTALALSALVALPACALGASGERAMTDAELRTHDERICPSLQASTMCEGVFAVPSEDDPSRHRLRFVDGQVSRNDSCMIRLGNRLNPKVPPMYVNGEPVGFC